MSMRDKEDALRAKHRYRAVPVWVAIALVGWLIIDIIGLGGNIRFYAKWLECGQKPVVQHIELGSVGPNHEPTYYVSAPTFSLIRLSPDQFCTPIEAERASLSAESDSWRFPHLEAAGEENPFLRNLNTNS